MILFIFMFTAAFGAVGPPLIKYLVTEYSPLIVLALRSLIAALIIAPFAIKFLKKINDTKSSKLLLFANVLFTLNWFFAMEGFRNTSILMNQIIYALVPIAVLILGLLFLKEQIKNNQIFGLILSLVGMVFLIHSSLNNTDAISFGTPYGNFITSLGLLSWSFYIVITRKISPKFNIQTILFFNFVVSTVLTFPIIFLVNLPNPFATNYFALFGLGLFSVVFFFLNQWLIKNTSAFTSSLILYIGPISGGITGTLFFKERITSSYVIGAALILIGVFTATSYQYIKRRRNGEN